MSLLEQLGIARLRRDFGLHAFVETGCWEGAGLRAAKAAGFEHLYSCDINPANVNACAGLGDVRLMDSRDFVKEMVWETSGSPTLWWLDAHFPEDYGIEPADELVQFPLVEELRILANKSGIENDVVLCDDMHALRDQDNPTFNKYISERYHKDVTVAYLMDLLPLTATLWTHGTGVLVFTPRLDRVRRMLQ